MRSYWKVKKKSLKSYKELKKISVFKRSDIIPRKLTRGVKVTVYNGRLFYPLIVKPKMAGLPFRSYVPSTVYGWRVQQKWADKKKSIVKKN